MTKNILGVIVGRFQCDELTAGHRHVIDRVFALHKKVVIFLGVSPMVSKKNPMDFQTRLMMMHTAYPDAIILPLCDNRCDHDWSKELDRQIDMLHRFGPAKIYGGRDCFFIHYHGKYPIEAFVVEKVLGDINATQIRSDIGKQAINNRDFRRGIIYARENNFYNPFPTVDIAPVAFHDGFGDTDEPYVLMASKPGEKTFGFAGGMVDHTDESYEFAACRELLEETNLSSSPDSMKYLWSFKILDWRLSSSISVKTSFFMTVLKDFKGAKAQDDIASITIIPVRSLRAAAIAPAHAPLVDRLLLENIPDRRTKTGIDKTIRSSR